MSLDSFRLSWFHYHGNSRPAVPWVRGPWELESFLSEDEAGEPLGTLTMSELNGFTLMLRTELLVSDHTLVLCLKAALTLAGRSKKRQGNEEPGLRHTLERLSSQAMALHSNHLASSTDELSFPRAHKPHPDTTRYSTLLKT